MLRGLYVSMIYLAFLALGVTTPFILSLGYVWVDSFDPQAVGAELLGAVPVSLIMGVAAIGGFFLLDRRPAPLTGTSVLLFLFAFWVTVTTALFAVAPAPAWEKWNAAFKTLCFAGFMPFVFRSRVQIEAFLQIYVFSLMLHFLPVGAKTLISGGGYGRALGVLSGNALLAEGSTLAAVSLMLVPIILYLQRHTTLLPRGRIVWLLYAGLVVAAIAAAIGTYERTALIGLAVMGLGLWLRSPRKLVFGAVAAIAVAIGASLTSSAWTERISTVQHYQSETSALGRLLVWEWTLDFVGTHPLGGGFNSYIVNTITFPGQGDEPPVVVHGKAFHSIYFEVLGEQGWPGLGLFGMLIAATFLGLRRVAARTRAVVALAWARDLARALEVALATLLACGAFIGIAFQPTLYYIFAISAALGGHVRVATRMARERASVRDEALLFSPEAVRSPAPYSPRPG